MEDRETSLIIEKMGDLDRAKLHGQIAASRRTTVSQRVC